jgi:thiol:disulfide interchange protein DsbC
MSFASLSSRTLVAVSFGLAFCLANGVGHAEQAVNASSKASDPRVEIARKVDARPEDVRTTPIPGLYEVAHGADLLYVSADGKYVIDGDLYDIDNKINLSEGRRTQARVAAISAVRDDQAIVFGPKTAKYTVTVFTDIDCGYCRKLHSEMAEINRLGIRVRYLFYPREGPGSSSWQKADAVWCAPDRNDALTRAKKGETIAARNCGTTPVARDYELGQKMGIRGTPGIFTAQGEYIAGYLPPQQLLAHLQELAKPATAPAAPPVK